MRFSSRRYVTSVMILGILIATFCLPTSVAHARIQNISITKLIDQPHYKETFFVITTNENTYHILVTSSITVIGDETLINITATLTNPHNTTIIASAWIPDSLPDAPYLGVPVEAFHIELPPEAVVALKAILLPLAIVIAIIAQVYLWIESIIVDVATAFLDMLTSNDFVWASVPWILLTLLLHDTKPDGSFDLYVPFSPIFDHLMLLWEEHYYVATNMSWWEIVKHVACLPWPFNWICWDYYTADWVCTRAEPPAPQPPHASFECDLIQPIIGEEIAFTSTSFDPDGYITAHHWWLGDGNESTEESLTHIYLDADDYKVTLEVTDNDGLAHNATDTISVQSQVETKLRINPDHLDVDIPTESSATAKFIARESLNQTDLQGVTFQASDLKNPDGVIVSSGNVTFDKNGISIGKGSYTNVTATFHAPAGLPIGWYNGNITAYSENGGNDTIYVDLRITPLFYELTVASSPTTGIAYTINGSHRMTPHTEMLPEASYLLEMPRTHDGYVWSHWLEDGDPDRIKAILLQGTTWTAVYEPAPKPVGGKAIPINISMNKLETPTLWIWLTTIILSTVLTIVYVKKRKRNTEINACMYVHGGNNETTNP